MRKKKKISIIAKTEDGKRVCQKGKCKRDVFGQNGRRERVCIICYTGNFKGKVEEE